MSGDHSAYAVLGLRPGAGQAEVDEAYRRLIKRYHPDRMGGDCSRAAEINRAYTQIRRESAAPARPRRLVPVPVEPPRRRAGSRGAGWMFASILVVAGALALTDGLPFGGSDRRAYADALEWATPAYGPANSTQVSPFADFEEPLQTAVIDRAIADAVRFHADGDAAATLEFSRACHNKLRDDRSLTWFDSCAAFDEATVTLSGDMFADSSPFNTSSIMARHMGAARLLSDDMFAADSRLHQIRSRVELALVPRLDEPIAPQQQQP